MERDFEDFELILIDDGSTDGTGELLDELGKKYNKRICVLHNNINLNVGVSIQRGMMVSTRDFLIHNGIDFPLAADEIKNLVDIGKDYDLLVMERRSSAGYILWRHITSLVNRLLRRLLFPFLSGQIVDMNFTQIYRRSIIKEILPLAKSPAFTTPEMIFRAKLLNLRIKSVIVDYKARPAGTGALGKPHDILWTLYDMLRFRWITLFKNNTGK